MTVLYFLMMVFSYSMRYRFNCVMFNFSIGSFFAERRHMGREYLPGMPLHAYTRPQSCIPL